VHRRHQTYIVHVLIDVSPQKAAGVIGSGGCVADDIGDSLLKYFRLGDAV
jgi:hypothetical protein